MEKTLTRKIEEGRSQSTMKYREKLSSSESDGSYLGNDAIVKLLGSFSCAAGGAFGRWRERFLTYHGEVERHDSVGVSWEGHPNYLDTTMKQAIILSALPCGTGACGSTNAKLIVKHSCDSSCVASHTEFPL
jgi:hypothetical protein